MYIFPNSTPLLSLTKTALFKKSMGFLNKAKHFIHITSQKHSISMSGNVLSPTF